MDANLDASESKAGVFDLRLINQSLAVLVNRVIKASQETDQFAVKAALVELREAAIAQFASEEIAMTGLEYGAEVQHHADHKQFLTEIERQIEDLEAGSSDGLDMIQFVQRWFLNHLVGQDMLFMIACSPAAGVELSPQGLDETRFDLPEQVVWSPKYSVDIQPIDEDHKAIFLLMGEIVEASAGSDTSILSTLLERLGDATSAHFRSEEKLMAEYGYEFASQHAEQHRKLLDEYAYQVDEYRNDSISAELMCRFVYQWFVRHIEMCDIPLSNALHSEIPS